MAFIVLQPEAAKLVANNPQRLEHYKKEVAKYVSDHKVRYKWLDGGIEFIPVLPKNPSGKILVRNLPWLDKSGVDPF